MSHLHDRVEHQVGVRLSEPRSYRRVSVTAMAPTSMAIPCLFYLTVQILHKLGLHQFRLRGAKVSIPRGAASATPRPTAPPAAGASSFNPLLHGAASATWRRRSGRSWSSTFQSPTSRGGLCNLHRLPAGTDVDFGFNPLLHGAASATPNGGFLGEPGTKGFQSPTSRGGLCNCHSELGQPSLASPEEPVVVVSSSGSNSEGGGQPPLSRGHFEVDHLVGVIHSFNLISKTMLYPSKLMVN